MLVQINESIVKNTSNISNFTFKEITNHYTHAHIASIEEKEVLSVELNENTPLKDIIPMVDFFEEVRVVIGSVEHPDLVNFLSAVIPDKASAFKRAAMLKRPLFGVLMESVGVGECILLKS